MILHFRKLVQYFELKRVGGDSKNHSLALLESIIGNAERRPRCGERLVGRIDSISLMDFKTTILNRGKIYKKLIYTT